VKPLHQAKVPHMQAVLLAPDQVPHIFTAGAAALGFELFVDKGSHGLGQ
jgi:hypothetical protein